MEKGHSSQLTEAQKYAEELEISFFLRYPNPSFTSARRPELEVEGTKIKKFLKCAMIDKLQETVKAENWRGRLFTSCWKDEGLTQEMHFAWMKDWSSAPTHTVQVRSDSMNNSCQPKCIQQRRPKQPRET